MGIEQPFLHWEGAIERKALTSPEMTSYLVGKQLELLAATKAKAQGMNAQEAAQEAAEKGAGQGIMQVIAERGVNGAGPQSQPAGGATPQESQSLL